MVAFGGLVVWLALTKQVVFRVLAACLAFIPAMVFGIAAVNKYYDYYQTWGGLYADLSGQSSSTVTQVAAPAGLSSKAGKTVSTQLNQTDPALDAQLGLLFRTTIKGPHSHISREVYIYLPPEYFWKAYATYRFPAIELLHGAPGQPQSWVNVMDVIPIFRQELTTGQATPAVLVMPDTNGGLQYSLQCLNDPHGLQDMTFVGREVPQWISANLRVQRPGLAWGIAGYSEGGFCAANIGLQYPLRFGFAGVLSGYFAPLRSQVPLYGRAGGKPHDVWIFGHDRQLALVNTPDQYILQVPFGIPVPQFFLAAGGADQADVLGAENFRQLLTTRLADALPVTVINGAGHQAKVWRAALAPMLSWMTKQLTVEVQHLATIAASHHPAAHKRPKTAPGTSTHSPKPTRSPTPHPSKLSSALRLSAGSLPGRRLAVAAVFRRVDRLHGARAISATSAGRTSDG
jgi:enterochelin esterase-like enzyme